MNVQILIEELAEAERQLRAAQHEDGGLYSRAKWRVDELKVRLFDAIGGVEFLQKVQQLEAKRDAPAIEPKRGEWAVNEFGHYCTNCHDYVPDPSEEDVITHNFCPSCGADMRTEARS